MKARGATASDVPGSEDDDDDDFTPFLARKTGRYAAESMGLWF